LRQQLKNSLERDQQSEQALIKLKKKMTMHASKANETSKTLKE